MNSSDIAKKCADIIYPISVLLDMNGHPVLIRTDDIVRRWSEKRTELDRYYKGDVAEYYLNKVEEAVNDPVKMTQLISNDLFFSQLFAFQYHNVANMIEFENEIMLIPFSIPLQFSSMQEIDMESFYLLDNSSFQEHGFDLYNPKVIEEAINDGRIKPFPRAREVEL